MNFEGKAIVGADFRFLVPAGSGESARLEVGGRERIRCGRVRCGGFSEANGLLQRLRGHQAADALSGSIDSTWVIPFGCEYEVERDIEIFDGCAEWTCDLRAVNRGMVRAVELEPVVFSGPWTGLDLLLPGDRAVRRIALAEEETELYRGGEPPVLLSLTAADGIRVEYALGGDLWRHRAALRLEHATGEFLLTGGRGRLTLERRIFQFDDEAVVEKRPWRFRTLFAWSGVSLPAAGEGAGEERFDLASAEIPEGARRLAADGTRLRSGCLSSSPVRKLIRDRIRRAGGDLRIENVDFGICADGAHLERPGRGALAHCDLDDGCSFYLWGNRQLHRQGRRLRLLTAAESPFAGSVLAENLGRCPRPVSVE